MSGNKIATNSSQIEPSYLLDKKSVPKDNLQDQSAHLDTTNAADKLHAEMMKQQRSSDKIDFYALEQFMKENEILCDKYNQSLDKKYQNSDHYVCSISLSENGKELIVYNFKP